MSQAALDANAFAEMKQLMGDTFNDIIEMCLQTLPQQLNEIEQAIENNNADALFNVSHKMKSSSGSIGAFGLAEKAENIERISRDGSAAIPSHAITELRDATEQVITLLASELNT